MIPQRQDQKVEPNEQDNMLTEYHSHYKIFWNAVLFPWQPTRKENC